MIPRRATYSTVSCVAFSLVLKYATAWTCYYPNGTDRNEPGSTAYAPIDPFASHSMCCKIGADIKDYMGNPDIPSPQYHGLCINTHIDNGTSLVREACTDPTWQDPACLNLCVSGWNSWSGEGHDAAKADAKITACTDGVPTSYCCDVGYNATQCCQQGQGVYLVDGKPAKLLQTEGTSNGTTPATFIPPASTNSVKTVSASSSPSAPSYNHVTALAAGKASPSRGGAIVAIVVTPLGGFALVVGAVWFFKRRKQYSRARKSGRLASRAHGWKKVGHQVHEVQGTELRELPATSVHWPQQRVEKQSSQSKEFATGRNGYCKTSAIGAM